MIVGLNPNACVSAMNALLSANVVWPIRVWLPVMLCRYASSCSRGVPVAGGVTTGGSTTGGLPTGLVAAGPVHMPLVHEYQRKVVASWAHTVCVAAT